jgi:hypothetical protein
MDFHKVNYKHQVVLNSKRVQKYREVIQKPATNHLACPEEERKQAPCLFLRMFTPAATLRRPQNKSQIKPSQITTDAGNHHHHRTIAFLRRFCHTASGFDFFGFTTIIFTER